MKTLSLSCQKCGARHVPTQAGSVVPGSVFIVLNVIRMAMTGSRAPFPCPLFGPVFFGAAVFTIFTGLYKASAYETARADDEHAAGNSSATSVHPALLPSPNSGPTPSSM